MKLTDAMVEGLRTLARNMMPRTNTVQALQRRGLVAEDYTITDAGWDVYAEYYPSEAAGYRAALTAPVVAPAISVEMPGDGALEIPAMVLGDDDAVETPARAQTAAQVAEIHPELSVGTAVTVFPDWSRGQEQRPHGFEGTVVRHARNGYVTVKDSSYGTTCDYDPRDVIPIGAIRPEMVLEDVETVAEDHSVTELELCTDCVMVIANGECTHDACRFPVDGFDPITDCPTVKGQAAVWGDKWSGLVLSGDEEDQTISSTVPCDGCGDTEHGDRHTAAHVEWLVIRPLVKRPRTLQVRGPWNRGKRAGATRRSRSFVTTSTRRHSA